MKKILIKLLTKLIKDEQTEIILKENTKVLLENGKVVNLFQK